MCPTLTYLFLSRKLRRELKCKIINIVPGFLEKKEIGK